MKGIIKVLLTFLIVITSFASVFAFDLKDIFSDAQPQVHYCQDDECGLKEGIDTLKGLDDVVTDQKFSEYSQNVVEYILGFLYLVAVILIIYSGFNIIVGSGSEERTKTSKSMILYVIVGVLIIFLAGPITEFILNILNGSSQ